jgi:hypothetical protein
MQLAVTRGNSTYRYIVLLNVDFVNILRVGNLDVGIVPQHRQQRTFTHEGKFVSEMDVSLNDGD